MAHILATCSRILYDQQILDDRNELEALRREKNLLQDRMRRLKMKYKFIELRTRMMNVEDFFRDLWVNEVNIEENAFQVLCSLCDCEYKYTEDYRSFQQMQYYPYDSCCTADCHIVFEMDAYNCPKIHFGKKWWNAKDINEQIPVYLLFYMVEQIYLYTNGWFNEGTFYWVIEHFLMPYKSNKRRLLQDVESFEEYFKESETFSLENVFS